jgi:hypothetical protein
MRYGVVSVSSSSSSSSSTSSASAPSTRIQSWLSFKPNYDEMEEENERILNGPIQQTSSSRHASEHNSDVEEDEDAQDYSDEHNEDNDEADETSEFLSKSNSLAERTKKKASSSSKKKKEKGLKVSRGGFMEWPQGRIVIQVCLFRRVHVFLFCNMYVSLCEGTGGGGRARFGLAERMRE